MLSFEDTCIKAPIPTARAYAVDHSVCLNDLIIELFGFEIFVPRERNGMNPHDELPVWMNRNHKEVLLERSGVFMKIL